MAVVTPANINQSWKEEVVVLTDEEVRHLAISLMTAPTKRDKQTRIGASNLAYGCDYCLAANFLGDPRETGLSARTWLGRTGGTATHTLLENRVNIQLPRDVDPTGAGSVILSQFANLEGAETEKHVWFAYINGYGKVGGSIDLLLACLQIIDWKSTTRKKLCILIDFLQISQGLEPIYGRTHKEVKLSEREYDAEMKKMEFKVTNYYGQQTLYSHGSGAKRASLVFICRDGTGFFDVPSESRYLDPTAVHDVHVVSFDYNEAYALALINRGQEIWDKLQAGATPADFDRHESCFPCSRDREMEAKVDVDVNLTVAA